MSDIVELMRAGRLCDDKCRVMEARSGCLCAEAADEIESLRAALAAARPVIRAEVLEEAARFIEGHTPRYDDANKGFLVKRMAFDSIGLPYAAAIRALKEKE